MRSQSLRLISIVFLALIFMGAGGSLSPKEEMKFGVEAARLGLWREALFRWQRAVVGDPENAHLRNNLAVAYESLGRLEPAREQYEEALRLDPKNKEIKSNFESFQELHKMPEKGDADASSDGGDS